MQLDQYFQVDLRAKNRATTVRGCGKYQIRTSLLPARRDPGRDPGEKILDIHIFCKRDPERDPGHPHFLYYLVKPLDIHGNPWTSIKS